MRCDSRSVLALVAIVTFAAVFPGACALDKQPGDRAADIYEATGVKGGLVIHIGCGDGRLTAALHAGDSYTVHGLARNNADLWRAREHIKSQGLYGPVCVDLLGGRHLPYVDGLATLVVSDDLGNVPMSEVRRILAPEGVAYIKNGNRWQETVKHRSDDIDTWTHFFHDASGNPVAHDNEIGPPRGLRWVGSPRWARHHDHMASTSAMVCSGKRVFYIFDEGSKASVLLPSHWKLIARDAFNGTILWKRDIERWHPQLYPFKSGPAQLTRRLVAVDEKVYVTLGLDAPLSVLDAATGETIRTFEDTAATEEIIVADGVVMALVNGQAVEWEEFAPQSNSCGEEKARVARNWAWNEKAREIAAFDAESGDALWRKTQPVAPMTIAADGKRVAFHNGECIVCLDQRTGQPLWRSEPVSEKRQIPTKTSHRLILYGDYILFAGLDNRMRGLSAETGEILWTGDHPPSGHNSMEDLMVLQGLVWAGHIAGGGHPGTFFGRDLQSGDVKKEFAPDVETYWFHHRCYPSKATDRYLLTSRTGIECIDPHTGHWQIHHWVRGGCLYGIMPANGMIYTPPHDCACYAEAKLYGFRALAPRPTRQRAVAARSSDARLERGPAYGADITETPQGAGDWPTFRHDAARSSFTQAPVPADLQQSWEKDLGSNLSSPVIAGGNVYVAAVDRHTVHALDEQTGEIEWSYTAGGRVDSPPTIYQGRVLFGSRDGYVYCLRASDGELIWRFRAAPRDVRLMAFEQVESVWPVHGSVLIEDGVVYCVAGRSMFLDEGMRLFRLDPMTGEKLSETVLDERDPQTGGLLQDRIMRLQMPVALPDILSSDGEHIYMRSQQFTKEGVREELGPHSSDFAEQACIQAGEGKHLFAPYGFLDGSWFHRSYWVYGKSYAGGAGGWPRAGHFAPAGRIMATDDANVYGYGRMQQYYKWTTFTEYHLFATSKEIPDVSELVWGKETGLVDVEKSDSLNPAGEPLTVEAWVMATDGDGVIAARGAGRHGYALFLTNNSPTFAVRIDEKLYSVASERNVTRQWRHLAGVLTEDEELQIYIDGELAGTAEAGGLIAADPAQRMQIGADLDGGVGDYESPFGFGGFIDELKIYEGALTGEQIKAHYQNPEQTGAEGATLVLYYPFEDGQAIDKSGNGNDGEPKGTQAAAGKIGDAISIPSPDYIGTVVMIPKSPSLDPTAEPLAVEAWVKADGNSGVIAARGGNVHGYSLYLHNGTPAFSVRIDREEFQVAADRQIGDDWTHLVGVLEDDNELRIYVNGELAGTAEAASLIASNPGEPMEVGADEGGWVGEYSSPFGFKGSVDELRVYEVALTEAQVRQRYESPERTAGGEAKPVLHYSFEGGRAEDLSGNGNDGIVIDGKAVAGKIGQAMKFTGRLGGRRPRPIQYIWAKEQPGVIGRALVVAGDRLFVAGPPDVLDEEEAFRAAYDPKMQRKLQRQDAALDGNAGALLWAVSTSDGEKLAEMPLDVPPAWDGMAAANGRLYMSTMDGRVVCLAGQ